MQTLRNSVYLIVTVGSIVLAACQPADRFTDTAGSDIAHLADASAQWLTFGSGSSGLPKDNGATTPSSQ